LIIATVALLLCLRRRRCETPEERHAQNQLLMMLEAERKPQA
jgi:hypothetical protein